LAVRLAADVLPVVERDFAVVLDRDVPRGEVAAEVRFPAAVLLLLEVDRDEVLLPRPVAVDLPRAVVVLRADAERPLLDDEVFPRELEEPERPPPDEDLPPLRPAAAFFAEEPPERLPPNDLFPVALLERFALVFAAPFLPAALFFAEDDFAELRPPELFLADEDFPELRPPPLFFALDEREPDDDPELFLAPPLDERDELDFLPPLLLLPDEREPDDFFVVAIRVFPPKKMV
jgi:hypothetical protein